MSRKIVSRSALRGFLRRLRGAKRIVFTNGCYDLLHAGHLSLLQAARRQGDLLIVGLNSDRSVKKIKGPLRPLVPGRERARLLAALECVDCVTFFDEPTPAALIREIQPDVLVKGGDWRSDAIVGREDAGRVVRVKLVPGRSTSRLIEKIVRLYGGRPR